MDRNSNHYQVASNPPEYTDNLENQRPYQFSASETLEREFGDDPDALATNLLLLLGLAARASQLSDIHGQDTEYLFGEPSQSIYVSLLERITTAGEDSIFETPKTTPYHSVYEKLIRQFASHKPWVDLEKPQDEFRYALNADLLYAARLKREQLQSRLPLPADERELLSRIRETILHTGEDHFVNLTRQTADQGRPINIDGFNLELIQKFCDQAYWETVEEKLELQQGLGMCLQRQRWQSIGRTYLRWIKVQPDYIAHISLNAYVSTQQSRE